MLDIIENKYNRCIICGERFISDKPEQVIRISKMSCRRFGEAAWPWEYIVEEKLLHSDDPNGSKTTADALIVHEECFFNDAPEDWKF